MRKKSKEEIEIEREELEAALQAEEILDRNHVEKLFEAITSGKLNQKNGRESKYKEEYIKELLYHVGIQGKSYKSLAFKLAVSPSTLANWEEAHPKWKEAKEVANLGRLGSLEDTFIDLAKGRTKGNAAAAIFYAKNAAPDDYKDRKEVAVSGSVTYVIDTGIPARQLPNQDTENIIEAEVREILEDEEDDENLL